MATKRRPAPPTTPGLTTPMPMGETAGRQVTLGDYIVEQLTAGVDPVNAALAAGVTPAEYAAWIREGTIVQMRLDNGEPWETAFTPAEQDACLFAGRARRAHGQHVARLLVTAEQMARGGLKRKTTRRKRTRDADTGALVLAEEHTTEDLTLPDGEMLRWKIAALSPDVYGKKARLDVTVHDASDDAPMADAIEARFAAVIDVLGVETLALDPAPAGGD